MGAPGLGPGPCAGRSFRARGVKCHPRASDSQTCLQLRPAPGTGSHTEWPARPWCPHRSAPPPPPTRCSSCTSRSCSSLFPRSPPRPPRPGRQWGLSASPPQPALRRLPHSVSAAAGPVQATTIFCLDDHSRVLAGLPAIVSAGVAGGSLRSVSHTPWLPQGPLTLPGVHVVTEAVSGRAHRAEVCTRRRGVVLKRWFLSVAEVAVAAVLVLVGGVCPLLRSPREKLRFRLSYAVALRRVPVDTLCQPCPGRCPWGSQAAPGAAFE